MSARVYWYESPPEPPWGIAPDDMVGPTRMEGVLIGVRSGFLGLSTVYVVNVKRYRIGDRCFDVDIVRETDRVSFEPEAGA